MKIFIFLAGLILANIAQAATLTASVDQNKITINETLTFQLRYNDKTDADKLDLNTLKQDFDVLGLRPQSSSNLSIINGQMTREELTIWNITLLPKREGALVIPSFNINGDISNAIRIDVVKASASIPQQQPIIVRLSSDVKTACAGQQILVKVELLAQNSVSNLSGDQLRLDNAEVELLDQQSFRKVENGLSWQIVEWTYSVFPEKAGTLAIPAQLFSGVIQTTSQRNPFDPFRQQRGQRISARSSATAFDIKKVPETNGLPWFPANNVVVTSSWSGDTSQMRVGEPLTRTLQIIASGQRSSVIPPLPETSSVTYKTYKDQPQLENQSTKERGIIGIRRESEAIVPSAAGLLVLPEQRVTWWNTNSTSWQDAVLPAESFDVLPALKSTGFAPPSGVPQFLPDQQGDAVTVIEATGMWWKIATAALGFICLIQFWFLLVRKTSAKTNNTNDSVLSPSPSKAWKELQKALKSGDPRTIRNALLAWSQIALPDQHIPSLQSLVSYLNHSDAEDVRSQLNKLDESLYKGEADLDINVLTLAIGGLKSSLESKPTKQEGLAPLYPT